MKIWVIIFYAIRNLWPNEKCSELTTFQGYNVTFSSSAGLLTMVKAIRPTNHEKLNKPTSCIHDAGVHQPRDST